MVQRLSSSVPPVAAFALVPCPSLSPHHAAAHTIFEVAKSRVYSVSRGLTPAKRGPDAGAEVRPRAASVTVTPVLEPQPKWGLLLELLQEAAQQVGGGGEAAEGGEETGDGRLEDPIILVACQDAFTASQVNSMARGCPGCPCQAPIELEKAKHSRIHTLYHNVHTRAPPHRSVCSGWCAARPASPVHLP